MNKLNEEVIEYYKNHTNDQTCKEFNLTLSDLLRILDLKKFSQHTYLETKSLNAGKNIYCSVDQDEVVKFYSDHSNNETCEEFNFTSGTLKKILEIKNVSMHTKRENLLYSCGHKYGGLGYATKDHRDKANQTRLERYGDPHFNNTKQSQQTLVEKHGSWENWVDKWNTKRNSTIIEKYGSKEAYNKKIQTSLSSSLLEKYGVTNVSCIPEVASKKSKRKGSYIALDGTALDSSWELAVYDYCIRNSIPIERNIPISSKEGHTTLIDFRIDGILFEVKGSHLLQGVFDHKQPVKAEEKIECYKNNQVVIITDYKELFPKPNSNESSGFYYNKNSLIGVDVQLFIEPKFPYREDRPKCFYDVSVSGCLSQFQAFFDEKLRWKTIKNRIKYSGGYIDSNQILIGLNVSKLAKQPSWFSKAFAKELVNKYITTDVVVDPFAGWGTRYEASIEANKNYVGCDFNKDLVDWHNSFGRNISYNDAKLFTFKEICSVFICPPYRDIEIYFEGQDTNTSECEWLEIVRRNVPNAKEYLMVCKQVDPGYEKYIVEEKTNKSHLGSTKEYVLLIKN